MPVVKIRREEMDALVQAADRMAKRMNARFVLDQQRVEIVDDQAGAKQDTPTEGTGKPEFLV